MVLVQDFDKNIMADTSKTFAALKLLLADNTIGAITEQVLRDLLESVLQYGGLRMLLSNAPAGQVIGTAFEKLTQWQPVTTSSTFITPNAVNDNFSIVKGGVFAILVSLSASGSNNSTWEGSLFVTPDGGAAADVDKVQFKNKLSSAGDVVSATAFDCITLADLDVVDYRLKADAATKTFTLEAGAFFLFRIG